MSQSAILSKAQNNRAFAILMAAGAPIAGSLCSFAFLIVSVWAAICIATRRIKWRMSRQEFLLAIVFSLYPLINVTIALTKPNASQIWREAAEMMSFFALWVLIPRLRTSPQIAYLRWLAIGSALAGIIALPVALCQSVVCYSYRAEAFSGNPGLFGAMAGLGTVLSLGLVFTNSHHDKYLAITGYFAGILCVVLSGSRGPFLTVIIASAACLLIYLRAGNSLSRRMILMSFLVLTAGAIVAAPKISKRIAEFQTDLATIQQDEYDSSIGRRIIMLTEGWQAAKQQVLTGYGYQNRREFINKALDPYTDVPAGHSHLHNAYLTAIFNAGLPGLTALLALLIAPLVLVALPQAHDKHYWQRLCVTCALVLTYGLNGMTGLIFGHDVLDCVYVGLVAMIAATVPSQEGNNVQTNL